MLLWWAKMSYIVNNGKNSEIQRSDLKVRAGYTARQGFHWEFTKDWVDLSLCLYGVVSGVIQHFPSVPPLFSHVMEMENSMKHESQMLPWWSIRARHWLIGTVKTEDFCEKFVNRWCSRSWKATGFHEGVHSWLKLNDFAQEENWRKLRSELDQTFFKDLQIRQCPKWLTWK